MELFSEITALAALAVVAVQQILKLNVIPVYFANKYPVITNIVLSIIASIVVQYQTAVNLVGWTDWVVYIATVSVVAAIAYNMTLRNEPTIQAASNKTEPTR
jgi:hypothetical protein